MIYFVPLPFPSTAITPFFSIAFSNCVVFDLPNGTYCDNDVVDHQVVNLEFDNGVTASMTMCAFTNKCERIINLMGTKGQIRGNMEENEKVCQDLYHGL